MTGCALGEAQCGIVGCPRRPHRFGDAPNVGPWPQMSEPGYPPRRGRAAPVVTLLCDVSPRSSPEGRIGLAEGGCHGGDRIQHGLDGDV